MSANGKVAASISRLAFELCQRNGIDVLGRLCADDTLSYPFRLWVIDEAISVNLITREELERPLPVLTRSSFGLTPDALAIRATKLPWWRIFARNEARRAIAAHEHEYAEAQRRHAALIPARLVQARERDIRIYGQCSGTEFERLVARAFRRHGYAVEEMGGANDGGVDLRVWKDGRHSIVQCKAHARPIGPAVVRELVGTLQHNSSASVAYLATTNGVTKSAEVWCRNKPIKVLMPDHLIRGHLDAGRLGR